MKKLPVTAFCAAQFMMLAQPASAAELQRDPPAGPTRMGSFVGARARVPLGATREKAHAGLAFTATQRSGETGTLRFSSGMELGFAGDAKVRLSLAGRPVSRLRQGGAAPEGGRLGMSTLGWVGIGAAVVAVGGVLWFVDAMNDASE